MLPVGAFLSACGEDPALAGAVLDALPGEAAAASVDPDGLAKSASCYRFDGRSGAVADAWAARNEPGFSLSPESIRGRLAAAEMLLPVKSAAAAPCDPGDAEALARGYLSYQVAALAALPANRGLTGVALSTHNAAE